MQYTYYPLFDNILESHLLIAGQTGSGKSVCIEQIIYNLLLKSPDSVQMILIDPKRVELNMYKQLPHVVEYANDTDSMYTAIKHAVDIMMDRFEYMEKRHLKMHDGSTLYIIIDEYADLILTDKKRIQPLIQKIGQLGRAARVRLILATQYVNSIVDVKIRANFSNRIALHTATAADSVKIIECTGAESLPQYGEMLFYHPGGIDKYKLPMVNQNDLNDLINHWTPKPIYKSIIKKITGLF